MGCAPPREEPRPAGREPALGCVGERGPPHTHTAGGRRELTEEERLCHSAGQGPSPAGRQTAQEHHVSRAAGRLPEKLLTQSGRRAGHPGDGDERKTPREPRGAHVAARRENKRKTARVGQQLGSELRSSPALPPAGAPGTARSSAGESCPAAHKLPKCCPKPWGQRGAPPTALSAHGSPSPCLFVLSRSALAADAVPPGHPEARRAPPGHRRPGPAPAAEALLQTRVRRPRPAGTSPPSPGTAALGGTAGQSNKHNASSHRPSSAGAGGCGGGAVPGGDRAGGAGAVCSSSSSWSPERLRALLGAGTSGPGAGSCVW